MTVYGAVIDVFVDPEEHLVPDAANLVRALVEMKCPRNYPSGFTKATMHDIVVYHRGTYVSGTDPYFDPLCIWGNEISMNKHQDIDEL
ncbi:LRR receptor-like serine/threonine-protein kinase RPK2 [Hordeum vulgare]|nr:LRR receptor-like serine/threonine-protein kinase RPK2 [Hordeum vulgare]